jgi:glycosyltransferase involved in cell wall biosynthesis
MHLFVNQNARLCFVSTIAWPLRVYIGPHILKSAETCDVTLVASGVSELDDGYFSSSIHRKDIQIPRKITPLADMVALVKLWHHLKTGNYHCVHSIMPKAGLIAMLAGTLARVPVRFHTFTGQVWVTRKGPVRWLLMFMDKLIGRLATGVLTDSFSQKDFLVANHIVKAEKVAVLGSGSVAGVDATRFSPNRAAREVVRRDFGIGAQDFVFMFVGRLNRDKGISELLQAFAQISCDYPEVRLILVGPDEDGYEARIADLPLAVNRKIHRIDFTPRPEMYMAASDVICLPSYREGFGSVLIEAAACGVPAVASRIYGITDAVVDRLTGILHEPGNINEIVAAMSRMIRDTQMRIQMGTAARARACECFSQDHITAAFLDFYRKHGVIPTS